MEPEDDKQYGRKFARWMYLLVFLVLTLMLTNIAFIIYDFIVGRWLGLVLSSAATAMMVWSNTDFIRLCYNRLRNSRRVNLRGQIGTDTPGFGNIVRFFPYTARNKNDGRWRRFKQHRRDMRRSRELRDIIERKIKRLDTGISYVEATPYGYGERGFRVWFRAPADAVAFKLRYSDDITILDME